MISAFGGLAGVMPVYAVIFMIVMLSSIGLPGLNGFVGEFLILIGAFKAKALWAVLAASGVVLGAIYMLWMYQRMFFGAAKKKGGMAAHGESAAKDENSAAAQKEGGAEGLKDLDLREVVVFLPILALIFFMGIYPKPFLSRMEPAVNKFVAQVTEQRAALEPGSSLQQIIDRKRTMDAGAKEKGIGGEASGLGVEEGGEAPSARESGENEEDAGDLVSEENRASGEGGGGR